jgi:23S rRNA (adenine2030-N6)-methyltransferase
LVDTGIRQLLRIETRVLGPGRPSGLGGANLGGGGLIGAGLIVVNPTWPFADQFAPILRWLMPHLAQSPDASWRMDWLTE